MGWGGRGREPGSKGEGNGERMGEGSRIKKRCLRIRESEGIRKIFAVLGDILQQTKSFAQVE